MNIIIGADLVPTKTNKDFFVNGDVTGLFGERLKQIIDEADYRIVNLEAPFADDSKPIHKYGANFKADTETINMYKAMNVNIVSLANNHIMDYGKDGLNMTFELLDEKKISYVGAGKNEMDADRPIEFICDNKKIGLYSCAEHEFSIAKNQNAGANGFNPLETFDHINNLKN